MALNTRGLVLYRWFAKTCYRLEDVNAFLSSVDGERKQYADQQPTALNESDAFESESDIHE